MIVKIRGLRIIKIKGEYIKLDSLLKFSAIASTGGEAKIIIKSGDVFVDGKPCFARGKKITNGCIIRCGDERLLVR
ncbi:MAG: RNA-binding S4 domain-containing protein [Oscillospiraceae bacterium]|nr:RNA-binding S4 domain-containing protein [Oscillospiraceae bacterium]